MTSGDHGLDALEPNDEAEEKAADPGLMDCSRDFTEVLAEGDFYPD